MFILQTVILNRWKSKIKEFLLALATGMRPAKLYNGTESAICGFLFVTGEGEVLCYQRAYRQTFADFLFYNSRLEKGSTEKDKYGYLERENGVYYFKLNLKIGLLKRWVNGFSRFIIRTD